MNPTPSPSPGNAEPTARNGYATESPPPAGAQPAQTDVSHEDAVDPARVPKIRWWAVLLALIVAAVAFHRLYVLGTRSREERDAALVSERNAYEPRPVVEVVKPKRGPTTFDLRLPADLDSMQETAVFARTSGYVKSLLVDIGDRVGASKRLAEIDIPEVAAQVATARAAVAVAESNVAKLKIDLQLAVSTLKRFDDLAKSGAIVAQDLDEKRSAVSLAESVLATAEANVLLAHADLNRLNTLQGFRFVDSPFAGVVTARGYDVGALVGPSGATSGAPLFRIERDDVLRVWVNVPQAHVAAAKDKAKGYLTVRNWPGREFPGELARTAGALDPASRTLRCQFDVPNPDRALFAGMFGELRFPVTTERPVLTVPTSAPAYSTAGPILWILEGDHARSKRVVLGRDYGPEIEIIEGVAATDDVIRSPGERLLDGMQVVVSAPSAPSVPPAPTTPTTVAPPRAP